MKTLLIVEDSEDDVFFLRRALKTAGVSGRLQVANDGQMAIDYLRGKGDFADRQKFPLPSLILLDLKLPYVMGLDVLKWIRERPEYASITVVALTSSHQQSDLDAFYHLGGNNYLIKPPDPVKLQCVVQSFIV